MRSLQNLLQCLWHATKIPSSSFWHLLYNNHQWKISNWSENNFMMHICTVATLCLPEKTVPRNYYYCVQDENSLCLCFKNMYRTLFVAIFTSTFIFSMYDHIGLPGCVFPYLSKYKYQQSVIWPFFWLAMGFIVKLQQCLGNKHK